MWDIKTHALRAKLDQGTNVGARGAMFVPAGLLVVGGEQALWRVWYLATQKPRVAVALAPAAR